MYLVFRQHDNGVIRRTTLLHNKWDVQKVISDAKNAAGMSGMIMDYSYASSAINVYSGMSLFYIDKYDTIQEL